MADKQLFLQHIQEKYTDIKVHFINQPKHLIWKTEKMLSDLNMKDLNEVNLRKIFPDEILLDIEEPAELVRIRNKLDDKNWSYTVWSTGSRGYHISLIFEDLKQYDIKERNMFRKYIIKEFGTDESKSSERTWLALEHARHFKTGNEKTLVLKKNGKINLLPNAIIEYVKNLSKMYEENKLEQDDDFKDFLTNPYLLWILEKEEPLMNGQRNSILFKNLAVGLVRNGLNEVEVREYAEKIVAKCPGKTISEFMGWVQKVTMGELKEYNIFEMVRWSEEYGNPVLHKIVGGEDDIKKMMSIKDLWDMIWNHEIVEQPFWKDLCFYSMLSSIVQEKEKDYRIHGIFSSFTSTGKDEGINLTQKVIDEFGLSTLTLSEATDKTLVGGVNETLKEFNSKNGLVEGETKVIRGKELTYQTPIEKGVLSTCDWIAFPEAESIFKPGAANMRVQSILRQGMDKKRRVEKGVGGFIIKAETNTVVMMATYPLDDAISKVLDNGLFQRVIFFDAEISKKMGELIEDHLVEKIFNPDAAGKYNKDTYIFYLVEKLKEIKTWYDENKSDIKYKDSEVSNHLSRLKNKFKKSYSMLQDSDQYILDAILRRGLVNINKLCMLNAVWNHKKVVTKESVEEMFRFYVKSLDCVKYLLLKKNTAQKHLLALRFILKDGKQTSTFVYEEMKKNVGIKSSGAFIKFKKSAVDRGTIHEVKEGNFRYLVLNKDCML